MAGEIYGWGAGERLADQDNQQALLNALAAQHTAGQIAMQPAQLRTANATAGLTEAQAKAEELKLMQNQRATEIARQAAQAGATAPPQTAGALAAGGGAAVAGGDPAAPMMAAATRSWQLADRLAGEGLITQADAARKQGDATAEKASVVSKNAAEGWKLQAQNLDTRADVLERLTRDLKPGDIPGMILANAQYEQQFGIKTGWSPEMGVTREMLSGIKNRAVDYKTQAELIRKDGEAASLDRAHKAQEAKDYAQAALERERTQTEKVRRDAIEKASGKPKEGDIKTADSLVAEKFPDMAKDTRRFHANEIAERANAIIAANRANGVETPNGASIAMNKAFEELNAAGNFKDYRKEQPKDLGRETEAERKAAVNYVTMKNAEDSLEKLEKKGVKTLSNIASFDVDKNGEIGAITKAGFRRALKPDEQVMFQAARQYAEGAGHLKSGARINNQTMQIMTDLYIPLAGDSTEMQARKKAARLNDLEAARVGGGRSVVKYEKEQAGKVGKPADIPSDWVLHEDAKGNKAYVSPDGKQFKEAK